MKINTKQNIIFFLAIFLQYLLIIFIFNPKVIKPFDSLLIHSIESNNVEMFKSLLKKKSWVSKTNNLSKSVSGATPLSIAISKREIFFVKELLEYGADPNGRSDIDDEPEIISAVDRIAFAKNEEKEKSLNILKLLIEKGANVNLRNDAGKTALHWASRFLLLDTIKILIDNGAIANVVDDCSFTPLSEGIFQ